MKSAKAPIPGWEQVSFAEDLPVTTTAEVPIFDSDKILAAAFDHYRATGFPYWKLSRHQCMQELNALANTEPKALIQTSVGDHVADTYHPHRFHGTAQGKKSPIDGFNDDSLLRCSLRLTLENVGSIGGGYLPIFNLVSGVQSCSNFRPGFALSLYRQYCKEGAVVLDTSTGYGGRLVGYMASRLNGLYIGIDPSVLTYAGNLRMAEELGFADQVELYNQPAEDVDVEALRGRCDFAFTSPPYFVKEKYANEPTQSFLRYPGWLEWQEGFLRPMLKLTYAALKPNRHAIVNVADITISDKRYTLVEATKWAAKMAGFQFIETKLFPMQKRFGANQDEEVATEAVHVFWKGDE